MRVLAKFNSYFHHILSSRFYYSQNAKSLSESAQRAVWSSAIINEILHAHLQDNLNLSLQDSLIGLRIKSQNYSFDESIREDELRKFTSGISFDSEIFDQNQPFHQYRNRLLSRSKESKLKFYPNLLVTNKLFNLMLKPKCNILINGPSGIGKTFSIVLYTLLSANIHRFIYETQHDKEKSDDLKDLLHSNLISNVPKYWYWSAKQKESGMPQLLEEIVIRQATELPQAEKNKLRECPTLDSFLQELKKLYGSAGIQQNIFVDQINDIVAPIHEWNLFIPRGGRRKDLDQFINSSQQLNSAVKQRIDLFQQFQKLGSGAVYISTYTPPINTITTSLVKKSNQNQKRLNLMKSTGQVQPPLQSTYLDCQIFNIPYRQSLRQRWGAIDFYDCFWLELEQALLKRSSRLKIKKPMDRIYSYWKYPRKDEVKMSQIKQKFRKIIQVSKLKPYFNLTNTHKFLSTYLALLDNVQTSISTERSLKRLLQKFSEYCLWSSKERLQYFISSGCKTDVTSKIKFIKQLRSHWQNIESDNRQMEIEVKEVKEFDDKSAKIISKILKNDRYQDLLGIQYHQSTQKMTFLWTFIEFIQASQPIVYPTMERFDSRLDDVNKQFLTKFSDAVKSSTKIAFKIAQSSPQGIIFKQLKFRIQWSASSDDESQEDTYLFADYNYREFFRISNYDYRRHVKRLEYNQSLGITFFLFSHFRPKDKTKFQMYCLNTDVVGKSLRERQELAKQVYSKIFSTSDMGHMFSPHGRNRDDYEFNHIIFCRKDECKPSFSLFDNVTVSYSPLEDLHLQNPMEYYKFAQNQFRMIKRRIVNLAYNIQIYRE